MHYVMIVDDDEDFATATAVILRREGFEVEVRSDTATALADMQRRPPDLAILDAMFPHDDFAGLDLARAMNRSSNLNRIPILMLTGINQQLDLTLDNRDTDNTWLPVAEFITKPVGLRMLIGKVKALLQSVGPAANHRQ
jgi:two-component system, OmpR family, response regulator ChvI